MEQHALQVVVLVQEDAPGPAAERGLELGAVEALGLDLDDGRPLYFVFDCGFVVLFFRRYRLVSPVSFRVLEGRWTKGRRENRGGGAFEGGRERRGRRGEKKPKKSGKG